MQWDWLIGFFQLLEEGRRDDFIPASARIYDKMGASGHIPVKHLADSNASRYRKLKEEFYAHLGKGMEKQSSAAGDDGGGQHRGDQDAQGL